MVARLADGTRLLIRRIHPDDKPLLSVGLGRLSVESARRRFLAAKPRFTNAELRYLTEVDGRDHVALVAVLLDQPDELVGVGRFVRLSGDAASAEVAITVGDCYQGRGVGTRIGMLLADEARRHGIRRFTADILADNMPAKRLLRRLSARLERGERAGAVEVFTAQLAA